MTDESLIDEMIEHLIEHCPDLAGYEMDKDWRDRPDRVLKHAYKPPVGVEVTELLPTITQSAVTSGKQGKQGSKGGSDMARGNERWDNVLFSKLWDLTARHPLSAELRLVSMRFLGPCDIHKKAGDKQLAREILALMLANLPRLRNTQPRRLSSTLRLLGDELKAYPLLSRTVDAVLLWIDVNRTVWWNPCHGYKLSDACFLLAVEKAAKEKSRGAGMYRENLRRLPDGENARLHLLLWTRNSCPPGPAADLSNRPPGFWEALAGLLRNSGFDAVWYNSQIPDGITWKIQPPWRLFPALDDDR